MLCQRTLKTQPRGFNPSPVTRPLSTPFDHVEEPDADVDGRQERPDPGNAESKYSLEGRAAPSFACKTNILIIQTIDILDLP